MKTPAEALYIEMVMKPPSSNLWIVAAAAMRPE
jgi:hypothetical protein